VASKKQLKRRNHTVNKSYLRRFANGDGQLMQVELPGDKRVLVWIADATVYKNFYLLRLPDGTETDAAEDAFNSDARLPGDSAAQESRSGLATANRSR
jgi:hypothetical protein